MSLLLSWLILTVSMYLTAMILPGFHLKSFGRTFFVAAAYGVLNLLVGWLLWTVLAIGTLGIALVLAFITRVVVNAILLVITDLISDTLKIDNFGWALGGAALMSVLMTVGERMIGGVF
jgi:uncharacterized membrane protein YvlD (DUF360 family)